jgi:hypothetical protein
MQIISSIYLLLCALAALRLCVELIPICFPLI